MKLLFILPVPYPLNSGGNQAVYAMIDSIRKDHEVSLLFEVNSHLKSVVNDLRERWDNVVFYEYYQKDCDVPYSELYQFAFTKPSGLYYRFLSAASRSVNRKKRRLEKAGAQDVDFVRVHSALYEQFGVFKVGFLEYVYKVARNGFDLVQVEFFQYLPLIYLLPEDVITVFVHHELRFMRNQNEIALFSEEKISDQYRYKMEKGQELAALRAYSYIITLTEVDRHILQCNLRQENIYASPAVIHVDKERGEFAFHPSQRELVFVGSGSHFPNLDAMHWFCSEVIPFLRKEKIDFVLYIVGEWNISWFSSFLTDYPEVKFAGFVKDLTSFLSGKISVVPIRIGSGMRMKILDAVKARSPFVTTSKGVEGLDFENNKDCLIANDAVTFTKCIVTLLKNEAEQQSLSETAFYSLRQKYNTEEMIKYRKKLYLQFAKESDGRK